MRFALAAMPFAPASPPGGCTSQQAAGRARLNETYRELCNMATTTRTPTPDPEPTPAPAPEPAAEEPAPAPVQEEPAAEPGPSDPSQEENYGGERHPPA